MYGNVVIEIESLHSSHSQRENKKEVVDNLWQEHAMICQVNVCRFSLFFSLIFLFLFAHMQQN